MAKNSTTEPTKTAEELRLDEAREKAVPWRQWGPYLSERQWGTVREDYSEDGNAWDYFTHDQARSRTYHWGEEASPVSVTTSNDCAFHLPCGMARTRYSRSGYTA